MCLHYMCSIHAIVVENSFKCLINNANKVKTSLANVAIVEKVVLSLCSIDFIGPFAR